MEQLSKFPNADDAIYRRGASDTFDPASLARDLERIAHGHEPMVRIPGFDHAMGDPVPDQHQFEREKHRVVICEGLVSATVSVGLAKRKHIFRSLAVLPAFLTKDCLSCAS
jgi:pantothenate kinase-related protein Tda10